MDSTHELAKNWCDKITAETSFHISKPRSLEGLSGLGIWSKHDGSELASNLPVGIYTVDIETCRLSEGYWVPFCAVVYDWLTGDYWYWVARAINSFVHLPIAPGSILIGHNICGYDRQYFENEYQLDPPYEYLDTMGFAVRLRGISSQQVPLYKLDRGDWVKEHYGNSLAALTEAYLGLSLDKSVRSDFSGKPWSYYQENALSILNYCAKDVVSTSRLFRRLWFEVLESIHPITIRAHGLLSKTRIPIDTGDLVQYIHRVSEYYDTQQSEVLRLLADLKDRVFQEVVTPWMSGNLSLGSLSAGYQHLDWTPAKSGKTKGQPLWYRKAGEVTLSGHLAPILLGVCYSGSPVYWSSGSWCADGQKIPHPEGKGNLGQIFNKHYWDLIGDLITTDNPDSYPVLKKIKDLQFWKAFQGRVRNALRFTANGIHIPDYKPWGTVSGRGSDSLWLVSPSPKADSPGSELRSLVRPPITHRIVGGDFASQEMRIFALLGDSTKSRLGSSELSQLLLGDGDIHTALSEKSGAPRKICKNINYGAIYGLGLKSGETYCRLAGMANPRATAKTVIESLKGRKLQNGFFSGGLASLSFNHIAQLMMNPETAVSPILGNRISKALRTHEFAPSRQNWYVQTSGCDLRDILVLEMHRLLPKVSLMLFVHDEPRYLVPESLVPQALEALQASHRVAIETMACEFGLKDLPEFFLYFDSLESDHCWRKSAEDPCLTPTNLDPVPPGQTFKR